MSLFSEMAAFKAALRSRKLGKTTFTLKLTQYTESGVKTETFCKVIVGMSTTFNELMRIFREARNHFEDELPSDGRIRRSFRTLFTRYFYRGMVNPMSPSSCHGELVYDARLEFVDCMVIAYDVTSPQIAIPRTSKACFDKLLVSPWEIEKFETEDLIRASRKADGLPEWETVSFSFDSRGRRVE